jgi:phosphinothricin acetyltransferase
MPTLEIAAPDERDLPRLTEIYNHYILETAVTFETEPYTVERRRPWLATFAPAGRYRCLVAREDGRCVGWAASRRFHERAAYDPTIETSAYLDPTCRGRGLGAKLYATLFDALRAEDIHRVAGVIALPNEASVALHRRFGFEPMGVMTEAGRKFGKFWDVGWFVKAMG